jgi:hypothetical protein
MAMRKALPEKMFVDPEQSRLSMLRNWVLDHQVTEIEMNERQFWNFAHLQPVAEKPSPTCRRTLRSAWASTSSLQPSVDDAGRGGVDLHALTAVCR